MNKVRVIRTSDMNGHLCWKVQEKGWLFWNTIAISWFSPEDAEVKYKERLKELAVINQGPKLVKYL